MSASVLELKAKRVPVLEERDALAKKGDKEGVAKCNAKLCRLNLAIQGKKPYEEELTQQEKAAKTRAANKALG